MTFTKSLIAGAVTAMLAAPVIAQPSMDMDGNADGMLDREEFDAGFAESGNFGSYDGDGDGMLSESEFNDYQFRRYDADQSGMIEETEREDFDADMGEGGLFDS